CWWLDTMLRTGQKLRKTASAVNAISMAANQSGGAAIGGGSGTGSTAAKAELSIAENARTIVSQFSHAKLPDSTSHSWGTITSPPATLAIGCGAKRANGTTS